MRIYIPQTLKVHTSNVAVSTLPAWDSGTTYALAAQVQYQADGATITRQYEAVQASNIGHTPVEGGNEWWADLGPTNRDAMFDGKNNTKTVTDDGDSGIMVRVSPPGIARYLCLLGLQDVSQVTVTIYRDPAATVPLSSQTVGLSRATTPVGWWTWLFGPHWTRKSLIVELPGFYYQPTIAIKMTGEHAACGQCLLCDYFDLGDVADGAAPSLLSYSTFQADEYGAVKYVARQNVRELNLTVWTPTDDFDRVYSLLEKYESELLLIDANHSDGDDQTDFDSLRVYGKITALRPGLQFDRSPIELRIQGLD